MKSVLRNVNDKGKRYQALMFACPGCAAGGPDGYSGILLLPVNCSGIGKRSWEFDGNFDSPTLSPSILSKGSPGYARRCHSFLKAGVFQFLSDSTHPLTDHFVPIPDLPAWAARIDAWSENPRE